MNLCKAIVPFFSLTLIWQMYGHANQTWERVRGLDDERPAFLSYTSVAIDPRRPGAIYVAGRPYGIRRSINGGRTWISVNHGLERILGRIDIGGNPGSLRFDPRNPANLYFGVERLGVFKSADQGVMWKECSNGLPLWGKRSYRRNVVSFAFPPQEQKVIFLGSDGGMSVSKDEGKQWFPVLRGLPDPSSGVSGGSTIPSIVVDPKRPNRMYAIFYTNPGIKYPGGIYRSYDSGQSWTPANDGLDTSANVKFGGRMRQNNGLSLAVDPKDTEILLAGTFAGIYRSENGASHWRKVANFGKSRLFVYAIVFDPVRPSIVYAGGYGFLARSENAGRTWQRFDKGIKPKRGRKTVTILDLAIDSAGTLYAATDAGLFRLNL